MEPASPLGLETILKRDRAIVIGAISGITIIAWLYMVRESRAMYHTGVCACAGMKMSGPDTDPWSRATLLPLFLMWTEMMIAMMLPSAAPMILTFATINRKRREFNRPYVHTFIFAAGYLVAWTFFSALAAGAQWLLHAEALLSPLMVSASPILAATLLIAAGIFQWTPLKNACLQHCRSPLEFIMNDWREGKLGALNMGIKHGVFCAGCCWLLMALLFVAGVMNILWIAALSVLVLLEKTLARGMVLGRFTGAALVFWGLWLLR